jgi:hypothetical protein
MYYRVALREDAACLYAQDIVVASRTSGLLSVLVYENVPCDGAFLGPEVLTTANPSSGSATLALVNLNSDGFLGENRSYAMLLLRWRWRCRPASTSGDCSALQTSL